MNSRDIVKSCINFTSPPRIAWDFRTFPINGRVWEDTDFTLIFPRGGKLMGADWGLHQESLDETREDQGQVIEHPLRDGWAGLEDLGPDYSAADFVVDLPAEVRDAHETGRYVICPVPALMQIPMDLRGMQNWFMDHLDEPENLKAVLDRILAVRLQLLNLYAEAGVDGVISWDDMGMEHSGYVSPQTFREIYFEPYRRTCEAAHARDIHFIHHCCGFVRDYLPMFHEAGADVLQLDQPELMGVDWLAENFGGKICFWCPVDIQKTMPTANEATIRQKAQELVWKLGNFGGGFMVKAYAQPNSIGLTQDKVQAQFAAFTQYGHYPLTPLT